MIIPKNYYKKEKKVKLTQSEIETIIRELQMVEHNLYVFLNLEKIINKLKRAK